MDPGTYPERLVLMSENLCFRLRNGRSKKRKERWPRINVSVGDANG